MFDGTEKPKLVEVSNLQPQEKYNLRISLSQVGPYTYRQKWLKQNVTWHHNGTISYKTRKVFTYTPSESCETCLEEDVITTINVPAISAYHQGLQNGAEGSWARWIFGNSIKVIHDVWMKRNVTDLLWGYDEKLFKASQYFPNPPPFEK